MIVYLGFLALAPKKAPMDGAAIFDFDLALLDRRFLDFELGDRRFVVIVVSPAAVKAWASPPQETDPDQAHVGRLVLVVMPWRYRSNREEYSQSVRGDHSQSTAEYSGSILIPGITYLALRGAALTQRLL